MEKEHGHLTRDIGRYLKELTQSNFGFTEFFIESSYKEVTERNNKCYLVAKKGSREMGEKLVAVENGLVPVYETSTGEKVVYGSELHKALRVKSRYREWIERRIEDCEATENEDFQAAEISAPSGQTKKDHIIELDTAKEMAMLERNEKGKQVRRYFIQLEKKYRVAQKAVMKQNAILHQFIEEQKEINQTIMDRLNSAERARRGDQKQPYQDNPYSVESDSTIESRKKELYRMTAKVAELCNENQTRILHLMYRTLEKRMGLVLDSYKSVYCSETGRHDACMVEVIASNDWLYESALDLNQFVIERHAVYG